MFQAWKTQPLFWHALDLKDRSFIRTCSRLKDRIRPYILTCSRLKKLTYKPLMQAISLWKWCLCVEMGVFFLLFISCTKVLACIATLQNLTVSFGACLSGTGPPGVVCPWAQRGRQPQIWQDNQGAGDSWCHEGWFGSVRLWCGWPGNLPKLRRQHAAHWSDHQCLR